MLITKIKFHKTLISLLFCSLFFLTISPTQAGNLNISLNEYINQVINNNRGLAGSSLRASGAKQRVGEGKLLMRPSFFAEGQYLKNSYDPDWSPIIGNTTDLQTYKAGISQVTPYGLQGKVYYNYQHQTINGIPPLLNQTQATASSPIVELDLPLSRNFAGRETRATAKLIDSQARLVHYSECYKTKMLIAEAEKAYWRLATLRNIVRKQYESLDRAVRIRQWVENRTHLRLAEDSDLLQAIAAVDAKQLDIQSSINDVSLAELTFNTLRGSCQEHVPEELCSFTINIDSYLNLPCNACIREDVLAAQQQQLIEISNAKLGIEKNKPNLNLYASYALNGNNPSSNQAISQSFTTNYPSTAVGLRLSLPLDVWRLQKDKAGYRQEIRGAQFQYAQKVYENQRLWEALSLKIRNAKKRLDIAHRLQEIQFKKLQNERQRLSVGRTTMYQVLTFEQDYENVQISALAIQEEILELIAELKTFGV